MLRSLQQTNTFTKPVVEFEYSRIGFPLTARNQQMNWGLMKSMKERPQLQILIAYNRKMSHFITQNSSQSEAKTG